jgi:hypothetical protein
MSDEPATAAEHNDVTLAELVAAHLFDYKRVAGPDGGQHAPSRDAQMQTAGGVQHFSRQLTSQSMSLAHGLSRKLHDTFELLAHDMEVLPTFPHERAVVTNTFS